MRTRTLWITVATLFTAGLAVGYGGAVALGGDLSAAARIETTANALVALGGTLVAAAVALGAVLLTLDLERQAEKKRRWADFQVSPLDQSHEWIESINQAFGEVMGGLMEYGHALDNDKTRLLAAATTRAQRFYDREQNLDSVERLVRLIESDRVRAALKRADEAMRRWNEMVAGDHTTRAVDLRHVDDAEPFATFDELSGARDEVLDAYAQAARLAHGQPEPA